MVTPEHSIWTLNIVLDKSKQILRVATQRGIRTSLHPIIIRYRTDYLDLRRKYISGMWYLDWMPAATKSIKKCRGMFVYSNGTFPKVDPK